MCGDGGSAKWGERRCEKVNTLMALVSQTKDAPTSDLIQSTLYKVTSGTIESAKDDSKLRLAIRQNPDEVG